MLRPKFQIYHLFLFHIPSSSFTSITLVQPMKLWLNLGNKYSLPNLVSYILTPISQSPMQKSELPLYGLPNTNIQYHLICYHCLPVRPCGLDLCCSILILPIPMFSYCSFDLPPGILALNIPSLDLFLGLHASSPLCSKYSSPPDFCMSHSPFFLLSTKCHLAKSLLWPPFRQKS